MDSENAKPLDEFSEPVCRYESTGVITNPQGQKLELKVRGINRDTVAEYMNSVRISFTVLPEQENVQVWEEPFQDEYYEGKERIDAEFQKMKLDAELDLEIDLDILEAPNLQLPYDLNIEIDPNLAQRASHRYRTLKRCRRQRVTLRASTNGVYGVLSGGGIPAVTGQADVFPPDPPRERARFSGDAVSEIDFYFSVTGLRANNTYSLNASMKLR